MAGWGALQDATPGALVEQSSYFSYRQARRQKKYHLSDWIMSTLK